MQASDEGHSRVTRKGPHRGLAGCLPAGDARRLGLRHCIARPTASDRTDTPPTPYLLHVAQLLTQGNLQIRTVSSTSQRYQTLLA